MVLLRHPLNCSACEINGTCELQDLVHQYDISHQDMHTSTCRRWSSSRRRGPPR